MAIDQLDGGDLLLLTIATFAGIIKLCMVFNESRIQEYRLCNGLIQITRDPMNIDELEANHDAMSEVE